MSVFLGSNCVGGERDRVAAASALAGLSIVLLCSFGAGCKKRAAEPPAQPAELESVITNRMNDKAYLEQLTQNRLAQAQVAGGRFEVSKKMKACQARVQAALPAGADEAAVQAALSGDAEWTELKAQAEALAEKDRQTLISAREAVRKRMEEEARAVKAVAEGRAKAADPAAP